MVIIIIRLLTREERIIQLPPLKQAEFTIAPSSASNGPMMHNSSMTALAASSLHALESRKTFTLNHSISGKLTTSHFPKVCVCVYSLFTIGSVCVCVCACACVCVRVRVRVCACTCACACACVCLMYILLVESMCGYCVCVSLRYVHACIFMCTYVIMCACVYVCTCMCVYLYVCNSRRVYCV